MWLSVDGAISDVVEADVEWVCLIGFCRAESCLLFDWLWKMAEGEQAGWVMKAWAELSSTNFDGFAVNQGDESGNAIKKHDERWKIESQTDDGRRN